MLAVNSTTVMKANRDAYTSFPTFPSPSEALKRHRHTGSISLLVVDRRREYGAPASRRLPFRVDIHIRCICRTSLPDKLILWPYYHACKFFVLGSRRDAGAPYSLRRRQQGGKLPHRVKGASMKFCTAISYLNAATHKKFSCLFVFFRC